MKRMASAALLLALVMASPAQGQLSDDPVDARLRQVWFETEGDWAGRWTPLNPQQATGAYAAHWTLYGQTAEARLQIAINRGGRVTVLRTQPGGPTCNYQGLFNPAGNVVTGTYTCAGQRGALQWRASVGAPVSRSASDRPSFDNAQAYLHFEWIEREGAWRGHWTPNNPEGLDGVYQGNWSMGSETAHANLGIHIENGTGRVRVDRADPGGRTCVYNGQIGVDLLTITGRYYCTDRPGVQLQWSARINVPNRP